MEIMRERLEREYDLELMATMPSVSFDGHAPQRRGHRGPQPLPACRSRHGSSEIRRAVSSASSCSPRSTWASVMELCQERRGEHASMDYLSEDRVQLPYDLPLARDRAGLLRSAEVAHAWLRVARLRACSATARLDLVKLDVLLNGEPVDAALDDRAQGQGHEIGRNLANKLREKIPRQQFDVPIQAAIGSTIIARETVKALRKDVTAKCYGGDISRKRKLLERQKEGKKRMKQVGASRSPGGVPRGAGIGRRAPVHVAKARGRAVRCAPRVQRDLLVAEVTAVTASAVRGEGAGLIDGY